MDNVSNPHDKVFREIYSNKPEAQSFLDNYLPPDVRELLDLESVEIRKDSFIDDELRNYYSDLLYMVRLRGEPAYIYVLFEHKSYSDRLIHLQLLEYMLKIWRLHLKQHKKRRTSRKTSLSLPIILPFVIYHGSHSWSHDTRFSHLLTGPANELAAYIPDFSFMLTDLTEYSDAQIKGTILSQVILLLFKHIFDADIRPELPKVFGLLAELRRQETGLHYLETILRYLYSAVEISYEEMLAIAEHTLPEQGGKFAMTIAEQLRQEGRQEGALIGEILLAQRLLKVQRYSQKDLEDRNLGELQQIFAELETQLPWS